jgi:ribosomal protein S27AE
MSRGRFYIAQVEAIERASRGMAKCARCSEEVPADGYKLCDTCRAYYRQRAQNRPKRQRWVPNPDLKLSKPRKLCKRCGTTKAVADHYKYCDTCREELRECPRCTAPREDVSQPYCQECMQELGKAP